MTARRYARALRRRAWIPLLLTAVALLGTGVLMLVSRPAYTATATVIANSPSNGATRTLGFAEVVDSETLLTGVIRTLRLSDSPETLAQRIAVTGDRSSSLYHVTVTDSDPARAAAIANQVAKDAARLYTDLGSGAAQRPGVDTSSQDAAYLNQYQAAARALSAYEQQNPEASTSADPAVRSEDLRLKLAADTAATTYQTFHSGIVQGQVSEIGGARAYDAQVVDQAVARPDTSSRRQRLAIAAVLGLAAGLGAVALLEARDTTLRDPRELETLVGAPVLGLIGHADGSGTRPAGGGA